MGIGVAGRAVGGSGGVRSQTADFEFSSAVRAAAASYIDRVVGSLGAVAYYRVGLSENGETYYPDTSDNGGGRSGRPSRRRGICPRGWERHRCRGGCRAVRSGRDQR